MSDFLQIHALTAYPPANLNRDDLGRPKTAVFGGTTRLRISSQSLKRAWRTSPLFEKALSPNKIGQRTKRLGELFLKSLKEKGVDEKAARAVARKAAEVFATIEKKGEGGEESLRTGQLIHVSESELRAMEDLSKRIAGGEKIGDAELKSLLQDGRGSADIALFGRMLADRPNNSLEAAAQVGHAISVHSVAVEDDYFTAVDDLKERAGETGAGHVDVAEFGAGVFYLYVCVNETLLLENLAGNVDLCQRTKRGLIEAIVKVAPAGKQNSYASRAYAMFALAERGTQQPRNLVVSFLKAVRGDDALDGAIAALCDTRQKMDAVYGRCWDEKALFDVSKGEGTLKALCDFVAK